MKLSKNSSFVIFLFAILQFRNIDRSTFRRSKFWPPSVFGGKTAICILLTTITKVKNQKIINENIWDL